MWRIVSHSHVHLFAATPAHFHLEIHETVSRYSRWRGRAGLGPACSHNLKWASHAGDKADCLFTSDGKAATFIQTPHAKKVDHWLCLLHCGGKGSSRLENLIGRGADCRSGKVWGERICSISLLVRLGFWVAENDCTERFVKKHRAIYSLLRCLQKSENASSLVSQRQDVSSGSCLSLWDVPNMATSTPPATTMPEKDCSACYYIAFKFRYANADQISKRHQSSKFRQALSKYNL